MTTNLSELLTPDYFTQDAANLKFKALDSVLIANSIIPWKVLTPTRLYHGTEDEIIPVSISQQTLLDLKAAGTTDSNIQLILIHDVGHSDGKIPVGILTIAWFMELKK